MARRDPAPVWFQTRPSRRLMLYLCAAHGLAGFAVWLAALPGWLTILLAVGLAASLTDDLRIHGLCRGRRATTAVHWQADGRWRVLDGAGGAHSYTGQQLVLAHPQLVLVRLKGPRRRWLLLAGDGADPDALRRLRVRLRRRASQGGSAQDGPLAGT